MTFGSKRNSQSKQHSRKARYGSCQSAGRVLSADTPERFGIDRSTRRRNCALIAAITVLSDISSAPTAGHEKEPNRDQNTGSKRNRKDIVVGRPHDVLLHLPVTRLAQIYKSDHVHRVVLDEDYVGRLDGNISATSDSDPDIGSRQRRRVVDVSDEFINLLFVSSDRVSVSSRTPTSYSS